MDTVRVETKEERTALRAEQEEVLKEMFSPSLTNEELGLVQEGLEQLPYGKVFGLIESLKKQAAQFNSRMDTARRIIMQTRIRDVAEESKPPV